MSIEVPEAGTCVARITRREGPVFWLDLLDEVGEGELTTGTTLELFLPRAGGIYHWPCVLLAGPAGQKAQVELVGAPTFVQRRAAQRTSVQLPALVRRLRTGRRGRAHEMTVVDMSRGGMKLDGQFEVSTGDTVEVTVPLSPSLKVVGRVVMAYRAGQGRWAAHMSFLEGQREAVETVDGYVASRVRGISRERPAEH